MPIVNLTDKEREELSARYDENKKTFERDLSRDLLAFFAAISLDVFASMATGSNLPVTNDYLQELSAILKKSYRKVGAFFSSHLNRLVKEVEPDNDEHEEILKEVQDERSRIEAALLLLLIPFYEVQSVQQAKYILETTQKIIIDERTRVLTEDALATTKPPTTKPPTTKPPTTTPSTTKPPTTTPSTTKPSTTTPSTTTAPTTKPPLVTQAEIEAERVRLAREVAKRVNDRNKKRVPNISSDQVSDVAQHSKQAEIDEVVKASRKAGIAVEPTKTWVTEGDSRVRRAHSRANKQKRKYDELYVVGGELLKYPKDMSHGASIGNTINCRCNSITQI